MVRAKKTPAPRRRVQVLDAYIVIFIVMLMVFVCTYTDIDI